MSLRPLRLRRILDPESRRALLLSFTSGMGVGVAHDMADLPATVHALAATGHPTGVILHAGAADSLFSHGGRLPCGVVVELFGGTWMTTQFDRLEQICTVEHAVRVGADAVLASVGLGAPDESYRLRVCSQIVRECDTWGLPLIVKMNALLTDARKQFSATLSGHGARLAYELGADLVIVNYSGEQQTFADAVRGIDIPVLVGGAPDLATDEALVSTVNEALTAGVGGVALNGGMFWKEGPTPALAQLGDLIFSR